MGLTLNYTWDTLDRLRRIGFPDGTTISNNYTFLDLVGRKDRLNQWTRAQYDNMRQLYSSTDASGNIAYYSWCSCGALAQVTDPLGNTTTYTRDNVGNVTRVDFRNGSSVTYTRDVLGRATRVSSSEGLNLTNDYNIQGLVTRVSNPAGVVFVADYDANDQPVSMTDGAGFTEQYIYDALGRMTNRYDPANGLEQFTYDKFGLVQYQDAMSRVTSYGYDPAGRLSSVTNANNEVTQFGYNPLGQTVSLTDGRNHTKRWVYDSYGRQIAETNANNVLVRTNGYDVNGRLTSQWTAAKGLTQFGYDANGNTTTILHPLSGTITCSYDKLNRLTNITDTIGATALVYTNFGAFQGALLSEDGPWNSDTVSYGYTGRKPTSIAVNGWTESIGYDSALRPNVFSSSAGTFTYAFNGAGTRVASLALPGDNTVSYGYSSRGDVNAIALTHNGTTLDSHAYDRDTSGMITKVTRANNSWVNYGYDPAGQLIAAQGFEPDSTPRANEQFGYGYDASGNLNHRTNNTLQQTFTSDNANELTQITRNNLLTVAGTLSSQPDSLTINSQSASIYSDLTYATPSGVTIADGANTFTVVATQSTTNTTKSTTMALPQTVNCAYDLNGNLISDGQKGFAYDDDNQLIRITSTNSWRSDFSYDGFGRRRVRKEYTWAATVVNWQLTNETHYVYDGMVVLQERDANNNVLVTYTRGLGAGGGIGGLLARTDSNGSAFYHSDAGGNITAMVDSSGNVVARYLYDPYGNLLARSGPLADANTYRFSSKEVHVNSGIYCYGFRYYEPNLQRWLNEDPIREDGGINLYQFGYNNPINRSDLFGLSPDDPRLPVSGGCWGGKPGESVFYHGEIFDKYGKGIPFINNQPDLKDFSEGQVVKFEKEFNINTDVGKAEEEMMKRNPKWKKKKGWQWHHFEGGGRRELQYVPAEINNRITHKCPPVAAQRKKIIKAAESPSNAHVGAVLTLTGSVLLAADLAQDHQEEFQALKKNIPLYYQARQEGAPTSGYSEEIASAYMNIFGNQLYYYAIYAILQKGKVAN